VERKDITIFQDREKAKLYCGTVILYPKSIWDKINKYLLLHK
jgi:hypothetical protein